MPMVRRRTLLATVALLGVVSPLFAHAGGAPTGDDLVACPHATVRPDGWTRLDAPVFPTAGGQQVTAFTAPAKKPRLIYATNGTAIKLSHDAGCKWDHIYPAPVSPLLPDTGNVVTHLVAPTDTSLWIAGYDTATGIPRPHVSMTPNATAKPGNVTEKPFESIDTGLPPTGAPIALAVPPVTGSGKAFLLLEKPHYADNGAVLPPTRHLYRMAADPTLEVATGAPTLTWTEITTAPSALTPIQGLAVSPTALDTVWIWSGNKYARSTDGGATWTTESTPGAVTVVDVDEAGAAAVFSRSGSGGQLLRIDRSGQKSAPRPTPIAPEVVAHGSRPDVYAIADGARTFGYDIRTSAWTELTPAGVAPFGGLAFGTTAVGKGTGRILLARTGEALYRYDLFAGENFLARKKSEEWTPGPPGPVTHLRDYVITPEHQTVTVAPGQRAATPVDFGVPPNPARLDVFFLIDTTGSMSNAIQGLRDGVARIAKEVTTKTRGQACFGLGDVKDYSPESATAGAGAITAYKRQLPVTCEKDLTQLKAVLAHLTSGGGGDVPEAQTIGLTQAVTGKGNQMPFVPEGQSANFVAPTRVIVLITDAGFKMEPRDPGYPSMDETVRTLKEYGDTKVVGVAVQTKNNVPGPLMADLTEITRRTKTVAPPNGVDCDGDKIKDLEGGDPLVCETENYPPAIAPAIVGLLLGVKEPGSVAVETYDPDHAVVDFRAAVEPRRGAASAGQVIAAKDAAGRTIAQKVVSVRNLREENHLIVRPTVTCSAEQDGRDLTVQLVGSVRGQPKASAEIVVRCRAPRIPQPPRRLPHDPPVLETDPIVPKPPQPPVVMVQFQPPPLNPPANVNPNAGFSQQEEQQMQLATVTQDAVEDSEGEEVELAMSALHRDDTAAAGLVLGCAALTSAAGGVVLARRRRVQRALRPARAS